MSNFIKGYACRSKTDDKICNTVMICTGTKLSSQRKDGWFWYVPGWFHTMSVRAFKKTFGFSIEPGTRKLINISISISER